MEVPKAQQENPLDKPQEVSRPGELERIYKPEHKEYLSYLQVRLERAKMARNQPYPEFNNKTYIQIYDENEKIANTYLPEKKNEDDVIVSAGTVESKLDVLLSNINNLDLSMEVRAYDQENNQINELGLALQDTVYMTEELDGGEEGGDEEKKMLRQRELLKQGTVFVQEEWLRLFERKKKLNEKFDGTFAFKNWEEKLELVFEGPGRTLLHGPNVYLGNITEFFMAKQPYVFVVIHQDYKVAETKYGQFEMWKHVKKGAVTETVPEEQRSIFDNKWRLTELKDNQVEIILYQDQPGDEFQILINGVAMLPIGFPLSAVSPAGKYNIAKQVFRPINHNFAYGKSFVASGAIKEISALIDEMLKLFVLKTRKSFSPPYINTSGKVISKKVLSPGRISMGIMPDALVAIGQEGNGVTSNEYNVLKELQDRIDKSTVSPTFAGQQAKGGTTATEIVEIQKQAKLTLGLAISACTLLEQKLGYLRLWNVLENWYNPLDTKLVGANDARREVNRYRNTVRETNIDGEGLGERQVIPTDDALPSAEEIRALEYNEEEQRGYPVRKIYLSPTGLKTAKLRWYVIVTPKEKESSAFYKLMFREQLTDMVQMMGFGSMPNKDGLEEEYSRVWGKSRSKLFAKGAPVSPDMAGVSGAGAGLPNSSGIPAGIVPE